MLKYFSIFLPRPFKPYILGEKEVMLKNVHEGGEEGGGILFRKGSSFLHVVTQL